MPLLRRKPVALIDPPADIPPNQHVWFVKTTGEIFTDYESYSNRLSFLLSRIFQCEYSGKTGLDYFSALESEKAESKLVRERFPDELKGRVLRVVQFRVCGRLDSMVDQVFDRFKDRYFAGEKVFVDLAGDKYFARIAKVFPPSNIREMARTEKGNDSHAAPSSGPAGMSAMMSPTPKQEDFSSVAHILGSDLDLPNETVMRDDNPEDYLYTVQLMDQEQKFDTSFMEVRPKALSRDRLCFSKSILKRYIRECVHRDALIGSPWIVKPAIAEVFGIPQAQSEETAQRNKEAREMKLARRRKVKDEDVVASAPNAKRRKSSKAGIEGEAGATPEPTTKKPAAPKVLKYPIEDLDLDPLTIHDGRILRRINSEIPPLPPKPAPKRDLPCPSEHFEQLIMIWSMLNIFGRPLNLSPFPLDDFASALQHDTLEPRCLLLAEVHACITNVIGTDSSRVLGSSGAVAIKERSDAAAPSSPAEEEIDPEVALANDFDRLIRKGIRYSRRWDRAAKLKVAEGRRGWERHLIGALCQRGGPYSIDNLYEILQHLFADVDTSASRHAEPEEQAAVAAKGDDDAEEDQLEEGYGEVNIDPEAQYLTLDLSHKLNILSYLITLVLGTKAVKTFIDDCETQLTEFRKLKSDVNKERKNLITRQQAISGKPSKKGKDVEPDVKAEPGSVAASSPAPMDGDLRSEASKDDEEEEDDQEDQLADDDDTENASEAAHPMSEDAASVAASDVPPTDPHANGGPRRTAHDERKLERQALAAASSRAAADASETSSVSGQKVKKTKEQKQLDDDMLDNANRDDWVEREFRRYQNVPRVRPLGKDRFFNRYWWFDGVGSADLVSETGEEILWGTGRLFIQGADEEEWAMACGTWTDLEDRQKREEVNPDAHVEPRQWAYYDTEEELEALQAWLNAKGNRELQLKNGIAKWRGYILAGAEKRNSVSLSHDSTMTPHADDPKKAHADPLRHHDGRRSTRSKGVADNVYEGYLGYTNKIARH